jgi:hypothetical protein
MRTHHQINGFLGLRECLRGEKMDCASLKRCWKIPAR